MSTAALTKSYRSTKGGKSTLAFVSFILLHFAFEMAFLTFVVPRYVVDYWVNGFNLFFYSVSWLLYLINVMFVLRLMKNKGNCFSGLATLFLFLLAYVPSNVMFCFMWHNILYILSVSAFWMLILLLTGKKRTKPTVKKVYFTISESSADILLVLFFVAEVFLVFYIIYNYNGFRFTSLSLDNLYEIRAQKKVAFSTFEGLVLYITAIIIAPLLVPIYLKNRKFVKLAILALMQLFLFFLGGDKFFAFILVAGVIFYFLYKNEYLYYLPILLAAVVFLGAVATIIFKGSFFDLWVYDIIVRRIFFTPSQIGYYYYDFFQTHPYLWMCDHPVLTRLGHLGPYFPEQIADYLGMYYWGGTGYNNGTFGNAFSEFGYLGIIIYPIMYWICCIILDKATSELDTKMYGILMISFATYLLDGTIIGIEFTYLLFPCVLYYLYKKANKKKRKGFINLLEKHEYEKIKR